VWRGLFIPVPVSDEERMRLEPVAIQLIGWLKVEVM
jgi:hypothetical protein